MEDEVQALVIDTGSGLCKPGFAGDEAPRSIFPTIVGRLKDFFSEGSQNEKVYVGDKARQKAGVLNLNHPIEHGIVTNWEDMEKLLHYTIYDELQANPSEHPILLTESPMNPKANRERMIQIIFETFNALSYYPASTSALNLFSNGRTVGISVDAGYDITHIVPIDNGRPIHDAITRFDIGGRDLTDWLAKILNEHGNTFESSADKEFVQDIKQKCTYVALDYDAELQKSKNSSDCETSYKLPTDDILKINEERFRCPELFFKPQMNGLQFEGIQKAIVDSITKCKKNVQKNLFANIVLSGGSTNFTGFPERLKMEISKIAAKEGNVKVVAQPGGREFTTWIGGSILASLDSFKQMVITHDEYNEYGAEFVHRKCPQ